MYVRLSNASVLGWVAAAGLGACSASEPPARAASPPPGAEAPTASSPAKVPHEGTSTPTPTPEATGSQVPQRATRFPAAERIVAVGDLHGDLDATKRALRLGGLLDAEDHWAGGKTVFVQTGDQLDRGDDEQAIVDLLTKLEAEAEAAGGAVHVLNGNHELMNAAGDFRYVTPGGMADFADAPGVDTSAPELRSFPESMRARAAAFLPGGVYAKVLATRNTAVIVGDTVFVHGGVLPKYAPRLDALNQAGRKWLMLGGNPPMDLLAPDGLVWARDYSEPSPSASACTDLKTALAELKATRMVVGHTVQASEITSACDDGVWRIDVGMAKHYGGEPAALEIRGDVITVLTEPG